jgi:acyl-CoA synthetase (AMP-forming)/AMP-acid ligase II
MLIGDLIRLNARRFGNKMAFKDERTEVTFEEVNQRANAIIHALMKMGVKKGDRIAILLYNCVEYQELIYALPKAGFIMVPLNYRFVGRELQYLLENSEATALIYDAALSNTVDEIRPELHMLKTHIVVGHREDSKTEAHRYEEMIKDHSTGEVSVPVHEDDVAYILYTSGTTGHPKGAMLTHRNILTNLFNVLFELQPDPKDKILNVPPLYHCAGQNQSMTYFFYGCPTLTVRQFDTDLVLKTIYTEKPNVLHLVPAMQNMILNHPDIDKYDFRFVDLMIYGAAPIMRAQLERSMDVFDCEFIQCAGQTEASPVLTVLRQEDHIMDGPKEITRRLGSAGREVKLTQVKIVDPDGNELPPNEPGEEIARGANVMRGYWRMPEATKDTIVDGWLHTGDICLKDECGFVYYKDRLKDMIIRGGENIYPREIEEVISTHSTVLEVAVIGIPDERLGEEILAVVVPKEGQQISEKEIIGLCEKNLARFKRPRHMEYAQELPKNPSGKVLKRELRERYCKSQIPSQK